MFTYNNMFKVQTYVCNVLIDSLSVTLAAIVKTILTEAFVSSHQGNIRVFCRVRPLLGEELIGSDGTIQHITFPEDNSKVLELEKLAGVCMNESTVSHRKGDSNKYEFSFDKVFTPESTQGQVFEEISQLVQVRIPFSITMRQKFTLYSMLIFIIISGKNRFLNSHNLSLTQEIFKKLDQMILLTLRMLRLLSSKSQGWKRILKSI